VENRSSDDEMGQHEVRRANMDTAQKLFEINKQLTTLSAGSAVLIATFMKDIFPRTTTGALNLVGPAKLAIFLAFAAFFLATICAVLAMLLFVRIDKGGTGFSVIFFLAGIFIFVFVVYLSLNAPAVTLENPNAKEPVISSP
jgi:hypothetical protein